MGGGMGFLFGGFMNSMEMRPYDHGRPMLALAKEFGKEYVKAGFSMAKNFAIIGGIYQASECGLEKIRAKTDIYNRRAHMRCCLHLFFCNTQPSAMAGCFTGGLLARNAGRPGS
jgi:hypothetical protein